MVEGSGFRFHVVDLGGDRLAAADSIENAMTLLRVLPGADRVINVMSYETLAYRLRRGPKPQGDA